MSDRLVRPGPITWVRYAFGATLAPKYRPWVLHDLTARTRWLRQFARTVVIVAPLIVIGMVLAGPSWIMWTSALGGVALATVYSVSYIDQYSEHRLTKHGFPEGTLRRTLDEAHHDENVEKAQKYAAMYR